MTTLFKFIGWVNEGTHDKVWTAFEYEGRYFCAWGRRGKSLSFKQFNSSYMLERTIAQKRKKYKEVDKFTLYMIFPELEDKVLHDLLIKMLQDKVKGM